jgi:hypothetical protein
LPEEFISFHDVPDPSRYAATSGGLPPDGATKSSTSSLSHDHNLAVTFDAWPELPVAVKAAILALISAASGKGLPGA